MNGIGVSPGISIGNAYILKRAAPVITGHQLATEEAIREEIQKFHDAVTLAIRETEEMIAREKTQPNSPQETIHILEAHIELLGDPQLDDDICHKISEEKKPAADATLEVTAHFEKTFLQMEDEYLRERAADIRDIGQRIYTFLTDPSAKTPAAYGANTILIAEDLTPSDTIRMDGAKVTGFATAVGGTTSHAAIIARSKGLPAVVGCGEKLLTIKDNDIILLDGQAGLLLVNPDEKTLAVYRQKKIAYQETLHFLQSLKNAPAVTLDQHSIKLLANIADADDMKTAIGYGCEGVGLLRTELLFLGRNEFPSEEQQLAFYKDIALHSHHLPITIRTLDIGGDKQLPYFNLPPEQNPFLGYRAIRICLDRQEIFLTQLRAILRASTFGQLKIMFPMISNIEEVRAAKKILARAKEELTREGIPFDEEIPVGIMIEIPSAAIIADMLAKEVDFFSIGTNDLCQYTLAVDRMNEKIKDLYDPYHPAVLRLIHRTIQEGHKNKIKVSLCGELAGDPLITSLLIGMGLQEFSMTASSIPFIKNKVLHTNRADAEALCRKIMEMNDSQQIKKYLEEQNA